MWPFRNCLQSKDQNGIVHGKIWKSMLHYLWFKPQIISIHYSMRFFALIRYLVFGSIEYWIFDCLDILYTQKNEYTRYMHRFKNVDYQQAVENLKVKLSLKKQVWSGMSNSVDAHHTTDSSNYQPLSWGISVVNKKKQLKLDANEELFVWVT